MRLSRLCFFMLWGLTVLATGKVWGFDPAKPQLLEDDFYKEYWEQHFLTRDGTLITSQFIAANFPWPVGNKHGVMIATIVPPDGPRTIIKNGRSLGKWGFQDQGKLDLFIHNHQWRQQAGNYQLHLGADDGHTIDATVSSPFPPLYHKPFKNKDGFMETAIYMPYLSGHNKWQTKAKDQTKDKTSLVHQRGPIEGFATHVLTTGRVEDMMENWLRVSGLGPDKNQPQPFLSALTRPDGTRDIILVLRRGAALTRFSAVKLTFDGWKKERRGSSYPTLIRIKATDGPENSTDTLKLTGTFKLERKIDHFNITDHLNFFESAFAQSRGSVSHYRYLAAYDLTLTGSGGPEKLSGKAFSEYQDILPPQKKKTLRRRLPRS